MDKKKQLENEIKSLIKHKRIFVILGISFMILSIALAITSIVISQTNKDSDLFMYFAYFASLGLSVSITMFILSFALFTFRINSRIILLQQGVFNQTNHNMVEKEEVKVKTKEEALLEQYENLMKQGYITKEDFEKKKEELSPKKNA